MKFNSSVGTSFAFVYLQSTMNVENIETCSADQAGGLTVPNVHCSIRQ